MVRRRRMISSSVIVMTFDDLALVSVRTDTGQTGHPLKGCVCPVRFVRSHGLAGQHRTLSDMSALSGMSGWFARAAVQVPASFVASRFEAFSRL
jgi:hypothetical protein